MPVERPVVPERRPRREVDQPRRREDPSGEDPSGEDRPREARSREERSREVRSRGERRPDDRPREVRPRDERSRAERHRDEQARPERAGPERAGPERAGPDGLDAVAAGESGIRHITDLTPKAIEGVTSVEPADGGWVVDVEVVEDRRVPSSGDILAIYEVQMDRDGRLRSYRRLRRYRRANIDLGQA